MLHIVFFIVCLQYFANCDNQNYRFGLFEDQKLTEAIRKDEIDVIEKTKQFQDWSQVKCRNMIYQAY